ncbi:hypothetical protein TVAG_499720 [Trichomonas vaginalis G3]|uniref:GAF domain-containing protein n=1 Tax=Trichomonas vaginalis (strain ATCC PRA-98 / G3) TaxID=412133 RepID=A2EIQ7_TRIV3|nr:cyclic nucleotide phosphodiesterase family [Trichomonas vaginalis G3]EAY07484.1 hypothetical protein TVAG_499720 [Trichomonas vaginalis G3]KAI5487820.1 cyclic nucleotide phosphodiesterase family [Trichomonas vaginalis G3]|eukprot:XP_001319707.1 hypothetical protein [Trichomonas vaginalis G3]
MGDRVHFSSASELLREHTFEAERLMELHTFHDAKERQLAKLKQEEKELQAILAEQKDLITIFGASVGASSESFGDIPIISGTQTYDSLYTQSRSARDRNEKLTKDRNIYPSDSASNLFAEFDTQLAHQPAGDMANPNANTHPSHAFAQSRQNYYNKSPIDLILQDLQETQNFQQFFEKYPLALMSYCTLFVDDNQRFSGLPTIIEGWEIPVRQQFCQAFIADCRHLAAFQQLITDMYNVPTICEMTSLIETRVPIFYNCPRAFFLKYEQSTDELVFLKEKIQLRFPLKQGIFQRAIVSQNPIESNSDDPEVSQSDTPIIQENKKIFIMPVLSVVSQYQVEGILCLFDKVGGIKDRDYLTTSMLARSIALMIPGLEKSELSRKRTQAFQQAVYNYVSLCTASEMSSIVDHIFTSFTDFFNCESVKLFKVSVEKSVVRELTKFETLEDPIPITGIVGTAITYRQTINSTKPQFSEHYDSVIDCYDENSFSSSLLVSPILDSSKVYWAVVLYNKKELPSFTALDEEALTTICAHMLPILQSAWKNKKLKKTIAESKQQVGQAEALTDVIASLKSPTDLMTMIQRMNKFFRENTHFTSVCLYTVDRFRNELFDKYSEEIDVISLSADHPASKCCKTGSVVEVEDNVDNTKTLYFPVLNTNYSVIGVLKFGGEEKTAQILPSKPLQSHSNNEERRKFIPPQASSLSILNTFRTSISSGRLLSWTNADNNNNTNNEEVSQGSVLKMVKMWQRICGSVLEGALKDIYYNRKKKLIDFINIALFENQFDASFKVWQEVQILIDDFKPLPTSMVDITCAHIPDIVFANTADLTERTINLLKALSSLNGLDARGFSSSNKGVPKPKSQSSMPIINDESGSNGEFLSTTALDFMIMDEDDMLKGIMQTFRDLGVLQFFGCEEETAMEVVLQIRALHPPLPFHSWRLAVDHFQYATFLLLSTGFVKLLSEVEMVSILLFLLTLYSDPIAMEGEPSVDQTISFTLETSGLFSTVSSLFTAFSWTDMSLLQTMGAEQKAQLWRTIDALDSTGQMECFVGASPSIVLCALARQSIFLRERDVAERWAKLKMDEVLDPSEKEDLVELMKIHLEFERDSIVVPILEEAAKLDESMKALISRANINMGSIIGG